METLVLNVFYVLTMLYWGNGYCLEKKALWRAVVDRKCESDCGGRVLGVLGEPHGVVFGSILEMVGQIS